MRGRNGLEGFGAIVVALGIVAAPACGDDAGDNPNDGGTTKDGSDEGLTNPDGGPIDPGGTGGGPAILELGCPTLSMPGGDAAVYVNASSGGGDGSKGSPVKTIGEAIAKAGDGGVIWVAAGTYQGGIDISSSVTIYGGFDASFGSRTDGCATTIQGGGVVFQVAASAKNVTIDGVSVKGGTRGVELTGDSSGALIAIGNSVFEDNGRSEAVGGAVFVDRASLKVSRTAFRNNQAEKGGAIAMYGEASTLAIEGCLFDGNVGHSDHGGAVYVSPKTGTIVRSTFRKNEIGKTAGYGWGGAVIVFKGGSVNTKVDFAYNVFTDNLASVGGAVFVDEGATATMSHDLLYKNRSILEGGFARGAALYVDGTGKGASGGSTLIGDHLTVVDNAYDPSGTRVNARGGGVYLESNSKATFTNSIFWNNGPTPNEFFFGDGTCTVTVSNSIAPSACGGGASCSVGDNVTMPDEIHFVDEAKDDYHEKSTAGHFSKGTWVNDSVTSPAVDKADPSAGADVEPAPNGGRANLGAYGRTVEASKSP